MFLDYLGLRKALRAVNRMRAALLVCGKMRSVDRRRNRRRQHLALCRGLWRGCSPGEERDADSEGVRVILSNITDVIVKIDKYACKVSAHAERAAKQSGLCKSISELPKH